MDCAIDAFFNKILSHIVSFQIHDDLEKEPEYSGSGFGPDDEDSSSSTHHNKPTSHHSNTNSGGRTPNNRKQSGSSASSASSGPIVPHSTHDDDDFEIGSGDKIDTDDDGGDEDDDTDVEEGVHKHDDGDKSASEYGDYDDGDVETRAGPIDSDHSPKVVVPHILVGKKPEKPTVEEDDDDDDFTTYVKQKEIDSTTTTITEERQLHGFVLFNFSFILVRSQFIYLRNLFDLVFIHPKFIRRVQVLVRTVWRPYGYKWGGSRRNENGNRKMNGTYKRTRVDFILMPKICACAHSLARPEFPFSFR